MSSEDPTYTLYPVYQPVHKDLIPICRVIDSVYGGKLRQVEGLILSWEISLRNAADVTEALDSVNVPWHFRYRLLVVEFYPNRIAEIAQALGVTVGRVTQSPALPVRVDPYSKQCTCKPGDHCPVRRTEYLQGMAHCIIGDLRQKDLPFVINVQPITADTALVECDFEDDVCLCQTGTKCPLGKTGMMSKCTGKELRDRGIEPVYVSEKK